MKCIKKLYFISSEGKEVCSLPKRVSNQEAERLVKTGDYVFTSKKEWKEAGRPRN